MSQVRGKGLFGGIADRISDALYEASPEEDPDANKAVEEPSTSAQAVKAVPKTIPLAKRSVSSAGTQNQSDSQIVTDATADIANMAPATYQSLRKILDGLKEVIPDETSRVKAALVALGAQGISTEVVLASFDEYLANIASFNTDFQSANEARKAEEQTELTGEISELDISLAGINEEITALQARLSSAETARNEKQALLVAGQTRYTSLAGAISAAVTSAQQTIAAERLKIVS